MASSEQFKVSGHQRRLADLEPLEVRRHFCSTDDSGSEDLSGAALDAVLAAHATHGRVVDHNSAYYKAARSIRIKVGSPKVASMNVAVSVASNLAATSVAVTTNAAGLPLLSSRPDGKGLKIFLDFDGYNTDIPFSLDADTSTFNTQEQTVIYNCWRDITSYYSMFDVNVTTVQPATGGTNPAFVWQRITDSVSGGAAYVGAINNSSSQGWTDDSNAVSRTSGIAHEIGHQLNLQHQSDWDDDADKINEYSSGFVRHGPIMGVDYAQTVHKFFYGRNTYTADTLQNDITTIASYIVLKYGSGDGYRPDDFTGTSLATATALPIVNGSFETSGTIERMSDSDYFSFTSTGSGFDLNVEPTYDSGLAPRLEIYDSTGSLLAAKDDTSVRNLSDNTNEEFKLTLGAGTYYAKVSSHGDYGDVGEYALFASPLPDGWTSNDVTATGTGRGGSVAYDSGTGTFTQSGSGVGTTSTNDSFHYTYQVLNGNGSITARVTSLASDPVVTNPRAGVMLRETLAANAREASIEFSPTSAVAVYRSTVGGSTGIGATSTSFAPPNWLRLIRTGNSVALATSTDGLTFTTIYTATLSSLATQVYLGLTTSSRDTQHPTVATFDNVALTGTLGAAAPTFNALPAPSNLSATAVSGQSTGMTLNWADVIGETGYAIERSVDGVTWAQIATTAANATAYTDTPTFGSMRWWYRISALDATGKSIYTNVATVINKPAAPTNPQAVAISTTKLSLTWRDVSGDTGYRVEQSTDGGATYSVLGTTAANIIGYNITGLAVSTAYTFRVTPLSAVGDGVPLIFVGTTALPAVTGLAFTTKALGNIGLTWTDLAGETGFRVERSTDNATWATIGTTAVNVTTFTDTTAAALTHYYYRVFGTATGTESSNGAVIFFATPAATPNPSPWVDTDLGTVGGSGAGFVSGATATVIGGGGNAINSSTDTENFFYRTLTGDGEIIAHVASLDAINNATASGVMMRDGLASNAKYAAVLYQSGSTYGTDLAYRTTAGNNGLFVDGPTGTTSSYLRLVRTGSLFTTYASTTGLAGSWVTIGSVTIAMGTTIDVGLFTSSRDNSYLAKSTFTNVSITPATLPTVASMTVNDGSAQRSRVTSLTVNFNTPVTIVTGAITLWRRATAADTAVQISGVTVTAATGGTAATLTFTDPSFIGNSLADGLYEIRVAAGGVTNSDGFAMAADASLTTYRLFGDITGDRTVSFADFLQLQNAFNSNAGDANFVSGFDYDNNGAINFSDFLKLQVNFGTSL